MVVEVEHRGRKIALTDDLWRREREKDRLEGSASKEAEARGSANHKWIKK